MSKQFAAMLVALGLTAFGSSAMANGFGRAFNPYAPPPMRKGIFPQPGTRSALVTQALRQAHTSMPSDPNRDPEVLRVGAQLLADQHRYDVTKQTVGGPRNGLGQPLGGPRPSKYFATTATGQRVPIRIDGAGRPIISN